MTSPSSPQISQTALTRPTTLRILFHSLLTTRTWPLRITRTPKESRQIDQRLITALVGIMAMETSSMEVSQELRKQTNHNSSSRVSWWATSRMDCQASLSIQLWKPRPRSGKSRRFLSRSRIWRRWSWTPISKKRRIVSQRQEKKQKPTETD